MGKIIIEIDDKVRNVFKSKVALKGKTIKEILTEFIIRYSRVGGKK